MALKQGRRSLIPKSNKSIGKLSRKAKARMNNAINWMVYLSEGKKYYSKKTKQMHRLQTNFITLTLSYKQFHDDKYICNRMLKPFLKWMKRQGLNQYVWRAETQANGNLHFHITSNKYLGWESIRNKWNSLQRKHGYIKKYMDKGGDDNPNSTDVDGVKDASLLAAYMVKYMGKAAEENYCTLYCDVNDKPILPIVLDIPTIKKDGTVITTRRDVECKVWNCSTDLMKQKIVITEMDEGFDVIANEIETRCESKQLEGFKLFIYPNNKFRDGLINYTDEQLCRNELNLQRK